MKKLLFLLLVILVSSCALASEFSSEMGQNTYNSKEAVWARLHFDVDLASELVATDVSVYNSENSKLAVTKNLDKVSDHDYYFSFILPSVPNGEYKIFLEDIRYVEEDQLKVSDFEVRFEVVNGDMGLQIWPPVWFAEFDNAFEPQTNLVVKNIGDNVTHVETIDEGSLIGMISPSSLQMMPNVPHWINIRSEITDFTSGFHSTSIVVEHDGGAYTVPVVLRKKFYSGDYDVPIYSEADVNVTDTIEIANVTETVEVNQTNETVVNVTSLTNATGVLEFIYPFEGEIVSFIEDVSEPIKIIPLLKNTGDVVVTDLDVSLTDGLNEIVSYDLKVTALKPGESASIDLVFDLTNVTVNRFIGDLVVRSLEGVETSLPIDLSLEGEEEEYFDANASQEFIGEAGVDYDALEDLEEAPSYVGWLVVLIAVIVVGILGYWFYHKGKKKDKEFSDFIDRVKRK